MSRVRQKPFVGRSDQLALMHDLLTSAVHQESHFLVVTGEPGLGKSRLLDVFLDQARGSARILYARADSAGDSMCFGLFTQALRPLLKESTLTPDQHRSLAQLLTPDHAPPAVGEVSRTRLFEAVLAILSESDRPVVLALDDIQWADPSSLELLQFLCRNARYESLFVVVLSREPGRHTPSTQPLFAELRRNVRAGFLQLQPLSRSDLAQLWTSTLDDEPRESDLDELVTASDGIPFFAELGLADASTPGSWTAMPRELLLTAGYYGLPEDTRHVIDIVAVATGPVDDRLLEACVGKPVDEAVAQGMACGMLVGDGAAYRIRHALYRDAVCESLEPKDRRRLHAAVAGSAEQLQMQGIAGVLTAAEVAWHWRQADQIDRAIPALMASARLASAALAFSEAHALWSDLLVLMDRLPSRQDLQADRIEILRSAAEAARWAGKPDVSVRLAGQALQSTGGASAELRAGLYIQQSSYHHLVGSISDAVWDVEQAGQLLGPSSPPRLLAEEAVQRARLASMADRDWKECLELARVAVDLARAAGEPGLESRAYSTLGVCIFENGADHEAAIEALRHAQRLAAVYGDLHDNIRACNNLSFVYGELGRTSESLISASEGVELARRAGVLTLDGLAGTAQCNLINGLYIQGRWDEAQAQLDQTLATSGGDPITRAWVVGTQAQLCAARGRFEESELLLDQLGRSPLADGSVRRGRAVAIAELACWQGRPAVAHEAVQAELDVALSPYDRAYLLVWGLRAAADLIRVLRLRQEDAAAERAVAAADEMFGLFGGDLVSSNVPVATVALVLAEHARATAVGDTVKCWEAVETATVDRPFENAYACARRVEALLDSRSRSRRDIETALVRSSSIAKRLRAQPLAAELEGLALRAGVVIDDLPEMPPDLGGGVVMTQREREVLAHLRRGLTNRTIARTLTLSERTVEVHVSNILRKLGVGNRTAAAAVAEQLAL